jgi:hypothetical protein
LAATFFFGALFLFDAAFLAGAFFAGDFFVGVFLTGVFFAALFAFGVAAFLAGPLLAGALLDGVTLAAAAFFGLAALLALLAVLLFPAFFTTLDAFLTAEVFLADVLALSTALFAINSKLIHNHNYLLSKKLV